jgi:hypothetical protein
LVVGPEALNDHEELENHPIWQLFSTIEIRYNIKRWDDLYISQSRRLTSTATTKWKQREKKTNGFHLMCYWWDNISGLLPVWCRDEQMFAVTRIIAHKNLPAKKRIMVAWPIWLCNFVEFFFKKKPQRWW